MPSTGKPSGACQACKQRHVKCDEARPACGRCVKANRVCPGYPNGFDLVLRDQNKFAEGLVKRRQNATKQSNSEACQDQLKLSHANAASLPASLAVSEQSQALSFFVSTYVFYHRDTSVDRGYLELLPLLFANLRENSPLSLALTAVSCVTFKRWERKLRDAEFLAAPYYGKAVQATRIALQQPFESISDETLMAVCLLGCYETVTAAFTAKISSPKHFNGAAALIEQRQNHGLSPLAKKLLIPIRSNLVSRAIEFSSPIDTTCKLWQDSDIFSQNPAALLDVWFADVANLLATAGQCAPLATNMTEDKGDRGTAVTEPVEVLTRAKSIDAKLATWPEMAPSHWMPLKVSADDIPQTVTAAGIYGTTCDVYPDIMICSTWNDWRVARLKVLDLIARVNIDDSRTEVTKTIQQLVDDICASIPFILGSREELGSLYEMRVEYPCPSGFRTPQTHQTTAGAYGGWYSFTPMRDSLSLARYLRIGQREWLQSQLQRLARMYDIWTVL